MTIEDDLKRVDEWAVERLKDGSEPPWIWYRLMQLREAIKGLSAGPCFGMEGVEETFSNEGKHVSADVLPFPS